MLNHNFEELGRLRGVHVSVFILEGSLFVIASQGVIIGVSEQYDMRELVDVYPRFVRHLQCHGTAHVAAAERC